MEPTEYSWKDFRKQERLTSVSSLIIISRKNWHFLPVSKTVSRRGSNMLRLFVTPYDPHIWRNSNTTPTCRYFWPKMTIMNEIWLINLYSFWALPIYTVWQFTGIVRDREREKYVLFEVAEWGCTIILKPLEDSSSVWLYPASACSLPWSGLWFTSVWVGTSLAFLNLRLCGDILG